MAASRYFPLGLGGMQGEIHASNIRYREVILQVILDET